MHLDGIKADWTPSSGLTVAGSGLMGSLLVGIVWFVVHQQSQVEVPDLAGVSRVVAEAQLKDRGLTWARPLMRFPTGWQEQWCGPTQLRERNLITTAA